MGPGPGRRRFPGLRDRARPAPGHRPHGVRGAAGRTARTEAGTAGMTSNAQTRADALREALATRVVVADGAMGTMLQEQDPS
ncbi:hypothetical protein, partial [Streptomyces sp. NPDC058613]|uniref:hypothetical protein n=1 Tax=unclassified Streptomyces TaxID=2593676 RepID=UPI00365FC0E5